MTMTRTLDEIAEDLGDCGEYLGEIETQYRSECAMFGDAGPGQGLEVTRVKGCYGKLLAEWRLAGGDVTQPPEHAVWDEAIELDPDDIPF